MHNRVAQILNKFVEPSNHHSKSLFGHKNARANCFSHFHQCALSPNVLENQTLISYQESISQHYGTDWTLFSQYKLFYAQKQSNQILYLRGWVLILIPSQWQKPMTAEYQDRLRLIELAIKSLHKYSCRVCRDICQGNDIGIICWVKSYTSNWNGQTPEDITAVVRRTFGAAESLRR